MAFPKSLRSSVTQRLEWFEIVSATATGITSVDFALDGSFKKYILDLSDVCLTEVQGSDASVALYGRCGVAGEYETPDCYKYCTTILSCGKGYPEIYHDSDGDYINLTGVALSYDHPYPAELAIDIFPDSAGGMAMNYGGMITGSNNDTYGVTGSGACDITNIDSFQLCVLSPDQDYVQPYFSCSYALYGLASVTRS